MASWQSLCTACASGIHAGGCCGCMACRVVPEPVAPLTRLEIEEAIQHLRATMKRAPKTMSARYHQQLNDLLDQRDVAVLEETLAEEA